MQRLFSKLFHNPKSHGEYVITVLDGKRLESLPNWHDYFDLKKYSFEGRWKRLSSIPGLVKQQTVRPNLNPTVGLRILTPKWAPGAPRCVSWSMTLSSIRRPYPLPCARGSRSMCKCDG